MSRLAWVLCLATGLAGCQPETAGNETALCTIVCRCQEPLPGAQRACTEECVREIDQAEVSNACTRCIFERSGTCGDLISECFLNPLGPCRGPAPPDDDMIPDAPRF